jgi:mRNA interferase MazF
MLFERGDIVLLAFPFSSGTGVKQRPALVLLDTKDQDLLVARVTTQRHQSSFDIAVKDWKQAGLLAPSWMRVHKLAAVEKRLVRRKLGRISDADWSTALAAISQMLG